MLAFPKKKVITQRGKIEQLYHIHLYFGCFNYATYKRKTRQKTIISSQTFKSYISPKTLFSTALSTIIVQSESSMFRLYIMYKVPTFNKRNKYMKVWTRLYHDRFDTGQIVLRFSEIFGLLM